MQTEHRTFAADAADMHGVKEGSVDLVVTSPPYPMINMWDLLFRQLDPAVGQRLDDEDGWGAFHSMHSLLDNVWAQVASKVRDGGVVCVNIGDATRSMDGEFRLYPNHTRITTAMIELGLSPLPIVLWRKQGNKPNKFMGSGMLPPNAYVTLDHEYVLVFRKGGPRRFEAESRRSRRSSGYFWEERNIWFSDIWEGLHGTGQNLGDGLGRRRSAAFPLELAYRLVNMYSIQGDVVLDPFWGTGTVTLAAMASARNSIGFELDRTLLDRFDGIVPGVIGLTRDKNQYRVRSHRQFMEMRETKHFNPRYGPVVTAQEVDLMLHDIVSISRDRDHWLASHTPH